MSRFHSSDESTLWRRVLLYLFARYFELPLLSLSFSFLRGRWKRLGHNPFIRLMLGWTLAAPFARLADTAKPFPFPQILNWLEHVDGPIAVGPCRCRISHQACPHPLETDIVIRSGVEAWSKAFPEDYRLISLEEAKEIITSCHNLGMWQMVFIHCPAHGGTEYVICNCCTCGCVPYILNRELGQKVYPFIPGPYISKTDLARCEGLGECVKACPFGARAIRQGKSHLVGMCFGCGRCVEACPNKAIIMVKRYDLHGIYPEAVRAGTV